MVQDTPSRKLEQYIVRFPAGMRDRIKDEAERNGRSMNAEIVTRLDASLAAGVGGGTIDSVYANTISQLMARPELVSGAQLDTLKQLYDGFRQTQSDDLEYFVKVAMMIVGGQQFMFDDGGIEAENKRASERRVRREAHRLGLRFVDDTNDE